jgi:hypothetical protein
MRCWIVFITHDQLVAFPPEVYLSLERAEVETDRWAQCLVRASADESVNVLRPLPGTWLVSPYEIRMKQTETMSLGEGELWLGLAWDERGYLVVDGELLAGRESASAWVSLDPSALRGQEREDPPNWFSADVETASGLQTHETHLAKVIRS